MVLLEPIWLVLVVPLAIAYIARRPASRPLSVLRASLYMLIVLTLADPATRRSTPGGTVVVIADRSASMPGDAESRQLEAVRTLEAERGPGDRIGVVTFGARARIEAAPSEGPLETAFAAAIDRSASSLGEAIETALSLAPADRPARLLVLSDGRATDGDGLGQAARAGERRVPIDHRELRRADVVDTAVERISAPLRVGPGESFLVDAWVSSPRGGPTPYTLRRSGEVIARGTAQLDPGGGRLTFRDVARPGSTLEYELIIEAPDDDAVRENNRARILVGVRDAPSVLVVSQTPGGGLASLLRAGGLTVDNREPRAVDWSQSSLAGYSAIVLENVAIQDVGLRGSENIARLVEDRGTGLVMTGGQRSFAAGGYLGTAVERVLPVSLELREEYRILAASIVVALDRSGSMSIPVPGGQTKMRLAGEAAASVFEMMSPIDRFGAIAVDSAPALVAPLELVSESPEVPSRLRRLRAGGGGIYVFEALSAAAEMLTEGEIPGTKHVVLFADAADAEAPGDYVGLLAACEAAGITVSVVALGTRMDQDAALLEDIARLGSGRSLFTDDARILPQLFAQDALAVVRGGFLNEPSSVQATAGLRSLLNSDLGPWPSIGGYNPTFPKPDADVAAITGDGFAAPVVAHWTAGLGRVATYAGEADGEWSGDFGRWDRAGSLLTSLVRSVMSDGGGAASGVVVRQRLEAGAMRVDVYTSDAGVGGGRVPRPVVRTLRVTDDGTTREQRSMTRTASDRFSVSIPLGGADTLVPAIDVGGAVIPLTPATLPYSPEHRPDAGVDGGRLLQRISDRSGGRERATLATIWDEMPVMARVTSWRPWLALLCIILLLLEVAERRIGVFDAVGRMGRGRGRDGARDRAGRAEARPERSASGRVWPAPAVAEPRRERPDRGTTDEPDSPGVLGALRDMRGERS